MKTYYMAIPVSPSSQELDKSLDELKKTTYPGKGFPIESRTVFYDTLETAYELTSIDKKNFVFYEVTLWQSVKTNERTEFNERTELVEDWTCLDKPLRNKPNCFVSEHGGNFRFVGPSHLFFYTLSKILSPVPKLLVEGEEQDDDFDFDVGDDLSFDVKASFSPYAVSDKKLKSLPLEDDIIILRAAQNTAQLIKGDDKLEWLRFKLKKTKTFSEVLSLFEMFMEDPYLGSKLKKTSRARWSAMLKAFKEQAAVLNDDTQISDVIFKIEEMLSVHRYRGWHVLAPRSLKAFRKKDSYQLADKRDPLFVNALMINAGDKAGKKTFRGALVYRFVYDDWCKKSERSCFGKTEKPREDQLAEQVIKEIKQITSFENLYEFYKLVKKEPFFYAHLRNERGFHRLFQRYGMTRRWGRVMEAFQKKTQAISPEFNSAGGETEPRNEILAEQTSRYDNKVSSMLRAAKPLTELRSR